MTFMFENLTVYQKALTLVDKVEDLCDTIISTRSHAITDQFTRAALSIPLNIAEGNGRWHKGDKRQFFWIARGSILECVAILQVLKKRGKIDSSNYESIYGLLEELVKMLTKLISSLDIAKEVPEF